LECLSVFASPSVLDFAFFCAGFLLSFSPHGGSMAGNHLRENERLFCVLTFQKSAWLISQKLVLANSSCSHTESIL
jgi:hypothetical protein